MTLISVDLYRNFQIRILRKVRYRRPVLLRDEVLGYHRRSLLVQRRKRWYIRTLLFPLDTHSVDIVVFWVEGTATAAAALHFMLPVAFIGRLLVDFEQRTPFSQLVARQVVLIGLGDLLEGTEIVVARFLILSIYENCLLFHINYLFIYFHKIVSSLKNSAPTFKALTSFNYYFLIFLTHYFNTQYGSIIYPRLYRLHPLADGRLNPRDPRQTLHFLKGVPKLRHPFKLQQQDPWGERLSKLDFRLCHQLPILL